MSDGPTTIGELTGVLLDAGIRFAMAATSRYPANVVSALQEEIEAGAEVALTVTLSPEPRLAVKVGKLVVFELAPEIDTSSATGRGDAA